MTAQKAIVRRYTDGFRSGQLPQILSCLSDDVVWAMHVDRLIEEGDMVAVVGHGCVTLDGGPVDFVYSEVFTFADGVVSRLDSFHIWAFA